jgi:hypothetical protein
MRSPKSVIVGGHAALHLRAPAEPRRPLERGFVCGFEGRSGNPRAFSIVVDFFRKRRPGLITRWFWTLRWTTSRRSCGPAPSSRGHRLRVCAPGSASLRLSATDTVIGDLVRSSSHSRRSWCGCCSSQTLPSNVPRSIFSRRCSRRSRRCK